MNLAILDKSEDRNSDLTDPGIGLQTGRYAVTQALRLRDRDGVLRLPDTSRLPPIAGLSMAVSSGR